MNKEKLSYEILEQKIETLEKLVSLTDPLKAQIQLNTSFLQMLFDAIPSPIFYKDKEGIYLKCNDAFSKNILGISKEEIIGKSLYGLPDRISKKHANIYDKKDKELLDSKGTQFYAAEVKCSDNVIRQYNFYKAAFISDSNEALGIVGIMMDITELEKQKKELKYLASTDPLTKLYNRRYFSDISESLLYIASRNKTDTSMMMLDIDNFKNINDVYGHEVGDDVLISLSSLLKKESRKSDIICRWGGEEFVILLPDTNSDGAMVIAEKLRVAVENLVTYPDKKELKITVSIGVSQILNQDEDIGTIVSSVDKALYDAKGSGKNRVCVNLLNQ